MKRKPVDSLSAFQLNRRNVLKGASGVAGTAVLAGLPASQARQNSAVSFTHGIASGDPLQTRIILWTRAYPAGGEARKMKVSWQIASDEAFNHVVNQGEAETGPKTDYTVKVDAGGLQPATNYFYRFSCEGTQSMTGRTRTLPAAGVEQVSLAVVSCSNYPQGFFHVYREIADRDFAAVLHLGDYIYEYPEGIYSNEDMTSEHGRKVEPKGEVIALDDYRRRYALYRSDPDLQAVHAAHPFICVWDDHEIANDTWRTGAQNHNDGEGDFNDRKIAALQAYHEWLPIRDNTEGDQNKIYRSFELGELATLIMMDTRLVGRDEPLTYGKDLPPRTVPFRFEEGKTPVALTDTGAASPDADATVRQIPVPFRINGNDAQPILDWNEIQALDPNNLPEGVTYLPDLERFKNDILPASDRSMLGSEQQAWLDATLKASKDAGKPWQILGQQVLSGKVGIPMIADDDIDTSKNSFVTPRQIAEFRALSAMDLPLNLDAWDGYPAAREDLFSSIEAHAENVVLLAGDTHNAWAFDLADEQGKPVAVEFGTAGVSSPGMEEYLPVQPDVVAEAIKAKSPELKFLDSSHRGWLELQVERDAITATFRFVSTVRNADYELATPVQRIVKAGKHKMES